MTKAAPPEVKALETAPRTVVIAPRPGIGDMIWHIPLLRAVAATSRDGQISLMTRPSVQAQWLFRGEPMVAETLSLTGSAGAFNAVRSFCGMCAALKRGGHQRAVILHAGPRFGAAAALVGIKERVGYARPGRKGWLTRPVDVRGGLDILGAFDEMRAFSWRSGFMPADPAPDLRADPAATAAMLERFGALPRPWLAVGVGATSQDRLWPMERFGQLAQNLAAAGAGTLFALGGPGDAARAQAMTAAAAGAPVAAATDLRLDQTTALLGLADAFVGVDSGPMNVSAALRRPTFAIFGSILNRMPLDLHPTMRPILPPGGLAADGMARVSVEQAMDAVAPFLRGGWTPGFPAHGIRPPQDATDYGLTDRPSPPPGGTWRDPAFGFTT